MKIEDARRYFGCPQCGRGGDDELTAHMGLRSRSSIGNWTRQGRKLIPELYARRLAEKLRGRSRNGIVLKFDPQAYRRSRRKTG